MEAKGRKNYIYIPSNLKWVDGSAEKKSRLKSFSPLGVIMPFVFILKIKANDSMIP